MLWIIFACTVGSVEPAEPDSVSAAEAVELGQLSKEAGRLSNRSRDLERAAQDALDRVAAGGDREPEIEKLQEIMQEIQAINAQLQADHTALKERVQAAAQSMEESRE